MWQSPRKTRGDEAPPDEDPPRGGHLRHRTNLTRLNFERLRGDNAMVTSNATFNPRMIAESGIDFANWDYCKIATAMISHVVMTEQLGGYTERPFQAMIDEYRVQQLTFTKFALRQNGNSYVFLFQTYKKTANVLG